ncbi:acetyltransferase [Vibrio cholerae]|nr:acetyltransferase [Vibrio cholerae]TQP46265.1 acetyltransferase [Vibrio cholerae]
MLCLSLVLMRCQPLRLALCKFSRSCLWQNITKSRVLLSRYGI